MKTVRSIDIANRHPRLRLDTKVVKRVIQTLDQHASSFLTGCPQGVLSIVIFTDAALAKIHADFLQDTTTTDVITFEGDANLGMAGEICISADRAAEYARLHNRDFATELTLYLVHGWLHLAGYDDLKPAHKRRMRTAEARGMSLLDEAKTIPMFVLDK